MTDENKKFIQDLIDSGGEKPGDQNEWDGYERFKRALREKFCFMDSDDYDAAIKQYSDRHLG